MAKSKEEKEAKKAANEKAKVEKKLNKAEADYKKAMQKAQKEKDPDKRAKKEAKAKEELEKSYNKTQKKYPEATQEVLVERQAAYRQKMEARRNGIQAAMVTPAPQATQQQAFDGNSNAYGNTGKTDIYGNAIKDDANSSSSSDSKDTQQQQQQEAKTLEEAMARVIMAVLEATLRAYMGPEWGYMGDRYAMKGQQFDSRIDEHIQATQARSLENTNTQTQTQTKTAEDRAAAPVVGELHIGSDGTMTYTDNKTQQSVSQNTNNQQLSVAQMMAISRGGRT